jgi:hypothetical protein
MGKAVASDRSLRRFARRLSAALLAQLSFEAVVDRGPI